MSFIHGKSSLRILNSHNGTPILSALFVILKKKLFETTMNNVIDKQSAHIIVDNLPDTATWEDLMQKIYEREAIERGLAASRRDDVISNEEIRKNYGIHP